MSSKPITPIKLEPNESSYPGQYPAEMVPEGQSYDGSWTETVLYRASNPQFSARLWESEPGVLETDNYPHDEFCLVSSGELVVTNRDDGSTATYGPGDTFVIPAGWNGIWDMKTRFRKLYVVLAPFD